MKSAEVIYIGNLIKVEDGVAYYNKFPQWVRQKYYDEIKGTCQLCKKKILYNEMEIHRIHRSHKGGKYTLCKLNHSKQNCKFLCSDCHNLIHSNETGCH